MYAPKGIRVNAILPGLIDGPIMDTEPKLASFHGDREKLVEARKKSVPMGGMGSVWDVARRPKTFRSSCGRSWASSRSRVSCSSLVCCRTRKVPTKGPPRGRDARRPSRRRALADFAGHWSSDSFRHGVHRHLGPLDARRRFLDYGSHSARPVGARAQLCFRHRPSLRAHGAIVLPHGPRVGPL